MNISDRELDKVEKLLIKAQSSEEIGSLEEANSFADKAREILMRYNMSIEDVDLDKKKDKILLYKYTTETFINTKNNDGVEWFMNLVSIVAEFNLCRAICYKSYTGFIIIGEQENVNVIIKIIETLTKVYKNLARKRWSEYKDNVLLKKNKFRRDYLLGAVSGLYHKYQELKREEEMNRDTISIGTTALIKNNELMLNSKCEEIFGGDIEEGKNKTPDINIASMLGHKDGKEFEQHQSIDN